MHGVLHAGALLPDNCVHTSLTPMVCTVYDILQDVGQTRGGKSKVRDIHMMDRVDTCKE